jgi:haloalkane dehalogenase
MPKSTERNSEQPFAQKRYMDIDGHRMAYIDEGEGAPIVFQHGNPTSSYLWRNIMPSCQGLGRLIACDFMGMSDSEKLDPALDPKRYGFEEQRRYLFGLWEKLRLGNEVVLVPTTSARCSASTGQVSTGIEYRVLPTWNQSLCRCR